MSGVVTEIEVGNLLDYKPFSEQTENSFMNLDKYCTKRNEPLTKDEVKNRDYMEV